MTTVEIKEEEVVVTTPEMEKEFENGKGDMPEESPIKEGEE
jgi:hypothetical protein